MDIFLEWMGEYEWGGGGIKRSYFHKDLSHLVGCTACGAATIIIRC